MDNITRTSTTELIMELTKRIESAKAYEEQTGREKTLQTQVTLLEERIKTLEHDLTAKTVQAEDWEKRAKHFLQEADELKDKVQGQYDDIVQLQREVEFYTKKYNELAQQKDVPNMPVIPKDVAIAIFREGVAHGVSNACDEIDNSDDIEINESEYCGDFEVSFSKYIDLSEHLDLDWMRDKVGDYDEASVVEALKTLCATEKFECRIHGVDDQKEKKND